MYFSKRTKVLLGLLTGATLLFLYTPLLVVFINSFNASKTFSWPPQEWTLHWWTSALDNEGVRQALLTSVKAGIGATLISIVLGTMVSFAVARYQFFGRETISLLVVLPIALPGIVTGIALNSAFQIGRAHV